MLRCHRESTNWREFCITEMNRAYIAKVPLKSFSFIFKYMFKTYTFTRSNIYPLSINASVNVLILWWLHFHIQRLTNNYKFSRKYSSNILHIFVILHWIDWIFSAQKKIFHHRNWLKRKSVKTSESLGGCIQWGESREGCRQNWVAVLGRLISNFLHFSNKAVKYITEARD